MAGALRAEATLAAANLVYLLLLAGGAVVLPASAYGDFGEVAQWLPSGALGEAMRAAFLRRHRRLARPRRPARLGRARRPSPRPGRSVGVTRTGRAGPPPGRARPGPPWSPTSSSSSPAARSGSPAPASAARPGRAARTSRSAPHGELSLHEAIEFGNRTLTFVLVAVAIATFVVMLAHRPPRPARDGTDRRARHPGPGDHRRHHGAHRPEPVGGLLPPALLAGDHRRRRTAPAVGRRPAPPRPPRPAGRARLGDLRRRLGRPLRRHGRHRLRSARRRRRHASATASTRSR